MQCNVYNDTLAVCHSADKEIGNKITKESVLSFVVSVFDPLGLFAPFTMRMRIPLKSICTKSEQQGEDKKEEEDEDKFFDWVRELLELWTCTWWDDICKKNYKKIDLHQFSDASRESMCIVAYLRAQDHDELELSFVTGRCRIAAMKQQTILKLELQARLYSVRMRQLIKEDHDIQIQTVTQRTDSNALLQWLHSSHQAQQGFVTNRVGAILD